MICGPKGPSNIFVKREVFSQDIQQLSRPRLTVRAEDFTEISEHLGGMFRNVFVIDVAFAYSLLYPIDEVLAKFSYVRLAIQLNKVPDPIEEAALQVPARPRLTDVH